MSTHQASEANAPFRLACFGWANGVPLLIAANYDHLLVTLECPSLAADVNGTGSSSGVLLLVSAAVVDHWWDLRLFCRVKRLARMPEDGFLCTDVTVLHVKPPINLFGFFQRHGAASL